MLPRLTTEIWVQACLRQLNAAGLDAYLRHRGARERGGILLKINRFGGGCELIEPVAGLDGGRAWMRIGGGEPLAEVAAEEKIARRLERDPDLWVLEIEDRQGQLRAEDLPL
ncbi:MAG: DUF1491 family protein [Rhodothalassiaceae bacterium]